MGHLHTDKIARLEVAELLALDALLRGKSVSKAAAWVGVTQPTMSHLLARLRKTFGDALLVRGRAGFVLTEYAEMLLESLRELVPKLEDFGKAREFAPQSTRSLFRVACTEHAAMVLLPHLVPLFERLAPHGSLKALSVDGHALNFERLENARFDLLLGVLSLQPADSPMPADWYRKTLYEDRVVVIGRRLAGANGELSLEDFLARKHVVVSIDERNMQHSTDLALARLGLKRTIGAFLSTFAAAPFIVAHSNMIALMPSVMAASFAGIDGLEVAPPPVPFPQFPISMAWHPRSHETAENQWLRQLVQDAANAAVSAAHGCLPSPRSA
jgi:DNA-binding transcriptional LysR family regulator